ncbi:MAG TPA: beta-ketoacyl-[acyl-carrier-protein] synthase family protein, partial [Acidobacteriota bacterium]|nr:beta-ketoacyl-[acyl-carrier-protein] synthase family protein [Acidobacteriota bacterium]
KEGKQPVSSFFRRCGDMASAIPAKVLGLSGPSFGCDTACAASSFSVGRAFRLIQRGKAKAMIAGGGCAIVTPIGLLAFSHLGALSRNRDPEKASRPFDRFRDGFVMGEGGGAVVLEDLESARSRNATIYGELVGFGVTTNAHNLTDPSPDGSSELKAMQRALSEAEIQPESVDYIAAHGTSTPKNDEVETIAIKRLFGPHAKKLMVSSNKGQLGHTLSAAGVTNLICAVKAITEGVVPPTMHYENVDPCCDLDYVPNESRKARVHTALVNAFAFGGQNAVLAVRAI